MAQENGVLVKLAGIRQRFMTDFQAEAGRFRGRVQELREQYLNEIVALTLTDAKLSEVQRALDFFRPSQERVTVVPAPEPAPPIPEPKEVAPATAVTLAPPEKQAMKSYRLNVYGRCPACNAPLFEAQAKYCSQCAYPLEDG